jgi:hypothetical protein
MNNYISKTNAIIDNLPNELEDNKEIIKARFVEEVSYYEKKRDHTKRYYNIFRFVVTIGSIFLPAILSMGQMDPAKLPKNFDQVTFWSSWSISLMVTISNGFLQLFSLDKNYFNYSLVVEQLKTEGWQFFGLSGKYEEYNKHDKKAYKEFCKAVENIKRKQIETEFAGKGNTTKKKEQIKSDAEAPLLPEGGGGKNTPTPALGPPTPTPTLGPPTPTPTLGPPTPTPTQGPPTPTPTPTPTLGPPTPAPTLGPPTPAPTLGPPTPAPTLGPPTPAPTPKKATVPGDSILPVPLPTTGGNLKVAIKDTSDLDADTTPP